MNAIYHLQIATDYGEKKISVCCGELQKLEKEIDIMTISAVSHSYFPTKKTMLGALADMGISVLKLSLQPEIDLRSPEMVWLSSQTNHSLIHRIGCIEMRSLFQTASKEKTAQHSGQNR